MISRKKVVSLDDAIAGMVLSNALLDGHGAVLLPSATVLTDAIIKSLRRRGIETLHIENQDISEADLTAERERVLERLSILFRKCDKGSACRALLERITEYRLGELQ